MPQHPGLTTERLFLRQLELRDSNPIFAAYAYDPEVTRYLSCNPHSKNTETKALIKRFLADDQAGLSLTLIIEKSDTADLTDIIDHKINGLKTTLGFALPRKYWEIGLARGGMCCN